MRCHLGDNHTDNKVLAGRVDDLVRLITNGLRPGDTFVDIGAMCGRLQAVKGLNHVAALVGAAMCSACQRGSQGRWP